MMNVNITCHLNAIKAAKVKTTKRTTRPVNLYAFLTGGGVPLESIYSDPPQRALVEDFSVTSSDAISSGI